MRQIFIAFAILAFAAVCAAQANSDVSGTVTFPDESPAPGATVRLSGVATSRTYTSVSDANGNFRFDGVPTGRYVLSAESRDGSASAARLIEIGPGSVLDEPLALERIPSVREVVDVSIAANTVQPISEVSKTIDVIGPKELDSRNDVSVVDTLKTVPGFRVQQLGGFGSVANIKTRGLQEQATSVLIEGMRFRDPAAITGDASPFLADITGLGIDRIEVLRGSGSSVYGTNAIGGVIDLRTAEPRDGFHGNFATEAGGLGYKRVSGGLNGATGKFSAGGNFSRTVVSDGIDGEDDVENDGFLGRADYRPFSGTSFGAKLFLNTARFRLNTNPDTLGDIGTGIIDARPGVNFIPDANDPDSAQENDLLGFQARLEHVLSQSLVARASYQILDTERVSDNGPLGPGFQPFGGEESSTFEGRIDTLNARIDWSPGLFQTFSAGYEFESEDYGNSGFGPFAGSAFSARSGQSSNTFFVQHLAGFFESRLQLAGGFRAQFFSVGDIRFSVQNAPYEGISIDDPPTAYTFDGAAAWHFGSTGTKLRAHVGNGYRVPSLYERLGTFYSSFSQDFTALGDPTLKPERSIAFDAGIDQDLAGERVRISATYFYTKMTDIIGFGTPVPDIGSTPRPFGGYRNEEGGIARGVELSARAQPFRSTYLFASYTYTNSDQLMPEVAGSGVISTLGIPESQFTFVGVQEVAKNLTFSLDLNITSSYLAPIFSTMDFSSVIYRFDGNRRGDVSAVYRVPVFNERASLRLSGTIQNLFGQDYFENGFRTEGRIARAGAGIEF
ncbi:MAG: TonB-dependent receptor [Acidobacteriota bacterium]|nr:MAG: TonB-dependent receptor [Acidobacteriota bacterium]